MKQEEHAARAWIILTSAAMNRQTVTYKHLSDRLGVPPQGLGGILGHLLFFCRNQRLPPITALVVSKNGGKPGDGFGDQGNLDKDREKVFSYPWYDVQSPRADDFE
jgi:hypothetical protein